MALHALFPAVDSCWMRLIAEELVWPVEDPPPSVEAPAVTSREELSR